MDGQHYLHRRKSSKDEDENIIIVTQPMASDAVPAPTLVSAPPPPRNRVQSSPAHHAHRAHTRSVSSVGMGTSFSSLPLPPSAGPFRSGFNLNGTSRPQNGNATMNGNYPHSASPFRTSFSVPGSGQQQSLSHLGHSNTHSRTRSISAFTPPVASPLSSSFPPTSPSASMSSPSLPVPASFPFPSQLTTSISAPSDTPDSPMTTKHTRRPSHTRLHSRNLSIFFPRPGSRPQATISEDGTSQDIEAPLDEEQGGAGEAPVSTMPSAGSSVSFPSRRNRGGGRAPPTPLNANFTFGGRPPSSSDTLDPEPDSMDARSRTSSSNSTTSRRGHHHKHSLSHNFFSFLEPGANLRDSRWEENINEDLHTQPTPVPVSPWAPISPFPTSAKPTTPTFLPQPKQNGLAAAPVSSSSHSHTPSPAPFSAPPATRRGTRTSGPALAAIAAGQFVCGAWLWVSGQQIGSLAVTGLGYWIVFDALGVLSDWYVGSIANARKHRGRYYGNAPLETVLMFAQAVYLLFASVYVCKETVEHILLSSGGNDEGGGGHHHHHFDSEDVASSGRIEFPAVLLFITLFTLFGTAVLCDSHTRFMNITGSRLPSPQTLLRSLLSGSSSKSGSRHFRYRDPPPTSTLGRVLSNPFLSCPLAFALAILFVWASFPSTQHATGDIVLAGAITVVTFHFAYHACVVLGTVLMQTSPPRGSAGGSGKMDAFLRVMREIERHPQVMHLPAPHIWQLVPAADDYTGGGSSVGAGPRKPPEESLVVTVELHVKHDLGDDEVLRLTRWAWQKCMDALGAGLGGKEAGKGGPEVTVGIVRG